MADRSFASGPRSALATVGWSTLWALDGGLLALSVLGAMTIGIFVLPFAIVGAVLLTRSAHARAARGGLIGGLGLPFLYVAYLNRGGPGNVCTSSGNGTSCTDEMTPWPWLILGVALVVIGTWAVQRRRHAP